MHGLSVYCIVYLWAGDGVCDEPEDGKKRKTRGHGSFGRKHVWTERLGKTSLM